MSPARMATREEPYWDWRAERADPVREMRRSLCDWERRWWAVARPIPVELLELRMGCMLRWHRFVRIGVSLFIFILKEERCCRYCACDEEVKLKPGRVARTFWHGV
jgi:hypothetical protein